ncbi:hypothetical protein ACSBR1_025869 [Camellia fascicularis]
MYRVNLRPVLSFFPETAYTTIIKDYKFYVLCVVKNANEKDFTLSKTVKELCDLSPNELHNWGASWHNICLFIESLSPV